MSKSNYITHNQIFNLEHYCTERISEYPGLNKRVIKSLRIKSLFPDDPTIKDIISKKDSDYGCIDLTILSTSGADSVEKERYPFLVSIVMPTHNTEDYIETTLESIEAQKYDPFELIIVDDGSTDGTADAVRKYLCKRHNTLRARFVALPNIGNPAAIRNFALYNLVSQNASYISFMDDDDLYAGVDSLNKLVSPLIQNTRYICAYGGFDFIDDNNKTISGPAMLRKNSDQRWEWKEESTLTWFNIATRRTGVYHLQSLCIRTPSPIMPYYRTGSDAGYFARVIRRVSDSCSGELHDIFHVPDVIFHYRKRGNSISTKKLKTYRKLSSANIQINENKSVPKFYLECGMPEKYYTRENITEFEVRKRIPHIYNALYLLRFRDLMSLIVDAKKEARVNLRYILAVVIKDFLVSSKIRDFILFKVRGS